MYISSMYHWVFCTLLGVIRTIVTRNIFRLRKEKNMKKLGRRIIAIVCSLAMIVVGMAFSPAQVGAEDWQDLVPGQKNNVGIWTIEPVKHYEGGQETDWAQAAVDMDTVDGVDDFYFRQTGYSFNGTILNTSDLKTLYNLDTTKEYTMTLDLDVEVDNTSKTQYVGVKTSGGTTNLSETIKSGTDGTTLVWTGTIKPKSRAFQLYVYYGANCIHDGSGYGDGALEGGIYINSLTFTEVTTGGEATTATPGTGNCTICDPSDESTKNVQANGGVWTYTVLDNDGGTQSASYSGATAVDGFTYVQNDYSWQGAYWKASDLKSLYNLESGKEYDMTVSISPTCSQATGIQVKTTGAATNLAAETKTGTSGDNLTYSGRIKTRASSLVLAISYGNDGASTGTDAFAGGFTVNSVVFTEVTETTTAAPGTGNCTIAVAGDPSTSNVAADGGIWTYTVLDNDDSNQSASYTGADAVDGFTYTQNEYSWQGAYWKASDLKDEYNLNAGTSYTMTVNIAPLCNQATGINVRTTGGQDNLAAETKSGTSGDTLTYTGTVTPSANALVLAISYGNDGASTGTDAYAGGFTVTSVTFEPVQETTTYAPGSGRCVINDGSQGTSNVDADGGIWKYTVLNNDGLNQSASYSGADDVDGFTYVQDEYSWQGAYWKAEDLKDVYSLTGGTSYTMTVNIAPLCDDDTSINVRTTGGRTNMASETKTGGSGDTLTYTATVVPGNDPLVLAIGYGNDGENAGLDAYAGGFTVTSVTFVPQDSGWVEVTKSEDPDHPTSVTPSGTPWSLISVYNGTTQWGDLWYKIDGTASDVGGTLLKPMTTTKKMDDSEQAIEHFWWNIATLPNYLNSLNLVDGASYECEINYKVTKSAQSTSQRQSELRYVINGGDVTDVTVPYNNGTTNTLTVDFDYNANKSKDIKFELDGIEEQAVFQVTGISVTPVQSEWTRVPDENPNFTLQTIQDSSFTAGSTVTYNWKVFAGDWGGEGARLYYKTVAGQGGKQDMQIKVGAGNKWDPASAQVKLPNTEAYKELTPNTHYYMTYQFTSDHAGTAWIIHEGYKPGRTERIDVVAGVNTYTAKMTYLEAMNPDKSVYLSLSPNTYEYDASGQMVLDGDNNPIVDDSLGLPALPENTILSNWNVTFSREDAQGWTLVTDSRWEQGQTYDTIVGTDQSPQLQAYANSNEEALSYAGLSYKSNYYANGEDDIAKVGIRVDETNGVFNENLWAANFRIPNSIFYAKGDTLNDAPLEEGQTYTLRFIMNVDLPAGTDSATINMVRQGYAYDAPVAYTVHDGLNLLNGTISTKNGATTHDDYNKTGGIEFEYDETWMSGKNVQVDLTTLPEGSIVSDISWEFYNGTAEAYEVTLDGVSQGDDFAAGSTYTLPSTDTNAIGYLCDVDQKIYKPGATYTVNSDVNFTTIRKDNTGVSVGSGAAIYLKGGADHRGIAFQGELTVNGGKTLVDNANFVPGMIITPLDVYQGDLQEELDLSKVDGENVIDVPDSTEQKWLTNQPGKYRAGIINVKDANITRYFVAMAYTKIKFADNTETVIYSDVTGVTDSTSRSIAKVAYNITQNADAYAQYSKDPNQKQIIDDCAALYEG